MVLTVKKVVAGGVVVLATVGAGCCALSRNKGPGEANEADNKQKVRKRRPQLGTQAERNVFENGPVTGSEIPIDVELAIMEKLVQEGWRMPLTSYSPLNTGSHIMLSDAQIAQLINGTDNSKGLLLAAERNLRDLKEQLRNAERALEESAVLQLAELESVCDSHDLSIREKDGAQARLETKVCQLQARVIFADQFLVEAVGVAEGLKIENASVLERLDVAQRERETVRVDLHVAGRLLEEEQDARGCLEAKYDSIQEVLDVAERKNVDVQGRLDIVELEKKDLQGRLDSSSRENDALHERVKELQALLDVAASEKDSAEKRLEQQLDEQEDELSRIRSREAVREAAHDVAVGKARDFEALVSALNVEKNGLQERVNAAERRLVESESTHERFEVERAGLQERLDDVQSLLNGVEQENVVVLQRLVEKDEELQTSADAAAGYLAKIMALESSVTTLTAEKSEVHTDLSTAREVCVALSAKVDDGDRVEKQLTDILSSVSEKAEYAAKEHESLKIKFDANLIKSQCNEERLNRDIGTLTVARTDLVTQVVSVRKELLVAHAKIEELQVEVGVSHRSNLALEQDLRVTSTKLEQSELENAVLVGEKNDLIRDWLAAKAECVTLSTKVAEAVETERKRKVLLNDIGTFAENCAVELEYVKAQLEESKSNEHRFTQEIHGLHTSMSNLDAQLVSASEELSSANRKVGELQLEVESLTTSPGVQFAVAVHVDGDLSALADSETLYDKQDDSGVCSTRTSSAASSNDSG